MNGGILALDLATTTGWAEGLPGERPTSGTIRLASEGSPPEAVFGGLLAFLGARLTAFRYRMVIWEAPLDPRHLKTNVNTARILLGLPAVAGAVAHQTGHYGAKEASVHDVRSFTLGKRPAKGEAKQAVMEAMRARGFDPRDDNEADALGLFLYAEAIMQGRI